MKELAAALCKAQSQIKGAKKDVVNPYFKSKYADLASTWDACREALLSNGLSVAQFGKMTDQGPVLVTRLLHVSGEQIEGELPLLNSKQDMQGLGSAITYARRYGLQAIVGISSEDDDGSLAVQKPHSYTMLATDQKPHVAEPPKAKNNAPQNYFNPPTIDEKENFAFEQLPVKVLGAPEAEDHEYQITFEVMEKNLGMQHILKILSQKNKKSAGFYASIGEDFIKYKGLSPKQKALVQKDYNKFILQGGF